MQVFLHRLPCPRDLSLILAILINAGHPASDVIEIKVLTDLFCLLSRRFYRHEGLPDLCIVCCLILNILQILTILAILIQTDERVRGTGPRATGGTPPSVVQEHRLLHYSIHKFLDNLWQIL